MHTLNIVGSPCRTPVRITPGRAISSWTSTVRTCVGAVPCPVLFTLCPLDQQVDVRDPLEQPCPLLTESLDIGIRAM